MNKEQLTDHTALRLECLKLSMGLFPPDRVMKMAIEFYEWITIGYVGTAPIEDSADSQTVATGF